MLYICMKEQNFSIWLQKSHPDFVMEEGWIKDRLLPIILAGASFISGADARGDGYCVKSWSPEAIAAFDRLPEPEKRRVYDFVRKQHSEPVKKELPSKPQAPHDPKIGPIMKRVLGRNGLQDFKGRTFSMTNDGVMVWENKVKARGTVDVNGTDIEVLVPRRAKVDPKEYAAAYFSFRNGLGKEYEGEFVGFKPQGTSDGQNGSKTYYFRVKGQQSIRRELNWVRGITGLKDHDSAYRAYKNVQSKVGDRAVRDTVDRYNKR